MRPFRKDKPGEDPFNDPSRFYLGCRLSVLNWISSRYLFIELSRQLTLWPYMPLMLFAKRVLGRAKK